MQETQQQKKKADALGDMATEFAKTALEKAIKERRPVMQYAELEQSLDNNDYTDNRFQTIMARDDPYVARGLGFGEMFANPYKQAIRTKIANENNRREADYINKANRIKASRQYNADVAAYNDRLEARNEKKNAQVQDFINNAGLFSNNEKTMRDQDIRTQMNMHNNLVYKLADDIRNDRITPEEAVRRVRSSRDSVKLMPRDNEVGSIGLDDVKNSSFVRRNDDGILDNISYGLQKAGNWIGNWGLDYKKRKEELEFKYNAGQVAEREYMQGRRLIQPNEQQLQQIINSLSPEDKAFFGQLSKIGAKVLFSADAASGKLRLIPVAKNGKELSSKGIDIDGIINNMRDMEQENYLNSYDTNYIPRNVNG